MTLIFSIILMALFAIPLIPVCIGLVLMLISIFDKGGWLDLYRNRPNK
ncbi:MAG: hypothetical protein VW683_17480 [Betaproteobacteria bacterium]|jgi:hypothetical protein